MSSSAEPTLARSAAGAAGRAPLPYLLLACTVLAAAAGVEIFRTHDVAETVQALRMTEAILARQKTDELDPMDT